MVGPFVEAAFTHRGENIVPMIPVDSEPQFEGT